MDREAVIITGAAGGVGTELCKELAPHYRVIAVISSEAKREQFRAQFPSCEAIVADFSDASELRTNLHDILADPTLRLRGAISGAAVWPGAPLELAEVSDIRRTIEINAIAPLVLYQTCIASLRKTSGRLILVGSISGKLALPCNGAYAMSKFALEALADVCRREAGKWGVRTVLVEPGPIKTPMVTGMMTSLKASRAALTEEHDVLYGGLYDGFLRMVQEGYPIATEPRTVADAIVTALTMKDPPARIPVGQLAEFVCSLPRTHSDPEIDQTAISLVATGL